MPTIFDNKTHCGHSLINFHADLSTSDDLSNDFKISLYNRIFKKDSQVTLSGYICNIGYSPSMVAFSQKRLGYSVRHASLDGISSRSFRIAQIVISTDPRNVFIHPEMKISPPGVTSGQTSYYSTNQSMARFQYCLGSIATDDAINSAIIADYNPEISNFCRLILGTATTLLEVRFWGTFTNMEESGDRRHKQSFQFPALIGAIFDAGY
jgi:hypothetical protein